MFCPRASPVRCLGINLCIERAPGYCRDTCQRRIALHDASRLYRWTDCPGRRRHVSLGFGGPSARVPRDHRSVGRRCSVPRPGRRVPDADQRAAQGQAHALELRPQGVLAPRPRLSFMDRPDDLSNHGQAHARLPLRCRGPLKVRFLCRARAPSRCPRWDTPAPYRSRASTSS